MGFFKNLGRRIGDVAKGVMAGQPLMQAVSSNMPVLGNIMQQTPMGGMMGGLFGGAGPGGALGPMSAGVQEAPERFPMGYSQRFGGFGGAPRPGGMRGGRGMYGKPPWMSAQMRRGRPTYGQRRRAMTPGASMLPGGRGIPGRGVAMRLQQFAAFGPSATGGAGGWGPWTTDQSHGMQRYELGIGGGLAGGWGGGWGGY